MTMTPPESLPGGGPPLGAGKPPKPDKPQSYPGWLGPLTDGTYVDASEVIAVQPSGDGTYVSLYTIPASFTMMETTMEEVMALVTKHRKGGPPAVPPGQAKKAGA